MTPEDFPQFPDPRVREVMAAAANLVEAMQRGPEHEDEFFTLKTALFAAQHSKPKDQEHQSVPMTEYEMPHRSREKPSSTSLCLNCGRRWAGTHPELVRHVAKCLACKEPT